MKLFKDFICFKKNYARNGQFLAVCVVWFLGSTNGSHSRHFLVFVALHHKSSSALSLHSSLVSSCGGSYSFGLVNNVRLVLL